MIIMSAHYLQHDVTGILKRKEASQSFLYLLIFRGHVFFGLIAITVGIIQLIPNLRSKYLGLHRRVGYIYILSVLSSSLSGIVVAQFAMGGISTAIGFSILAMVWFVTTLKSLTTVLKGDIQTHKKWSTYSYALTFAAITQRTLLLIPLLTSMPFLPVYRLSAWLPWLLNLVIAHRALRRRMKPIPSGFSNALKSG